MLLVGKQVWFGRAVLAAYLLLVCFGHALHALPGHQHAHSGCEHSGCDSIPDSVAGSHAGKDLLGRAEIGSSSVGSCDLDPCQLGSGSSRSIDDHAEESLASGGEHSHHVDDCPYGHAPAVACAANDVVGEKCGGQDSVPAANTWPMVTDTGSHDVCLICDLLGSPQLILWMVEIDSAPILLHSARVATYALFAADVPSSFSARGPPNFLV